MSGSALSLDSSKNISKNPYYLRTKSKLYKCPNRVAAAQGIDLSTGKEIIVKLNCDQWHCPYCGARLRKVLMARTIKGIYARLDEIGSEKLTARQMKYRLKLLTLTWPGRTRRLPSYMWNYAISERKNIENPVEALKVMQGIWNIIRTRLLQIYPDMNYFLVTEPQRDGYPHLHILLVGNSVVSKTILDDVRRLWSHKHRMGNVDISFAKKGVGGVVKYLMDYVTKSFCAPVNNYPGKRKFSCSQGLLEKRWYVEKNPDFVYFSIGRMIMGPNGKENYSPSFETPNVITHYDCNVPVAKDLDQIIIESNLKECMDFFDQVHWHRQVPLTLEWSTTGYKKDNA